MTTLDETLQRYRAGGEPYDSLALLRPYLVAACLGDDLAAFLLTLYRRADQPTLLRRLSRYAAARAPEAHRRFEAQAAPLFAQSLPPSTHR